MNEEERKKKKRNRVKMLFSAERTHKRCAGDNENSN